MQEFLESVCDAVVIGAGHAGAEAALALARTGLSTVLMTLNLDSIGFMPCNPSVGGTAKGHLVREIDALGGQMGVTADECALQVRMLNAGKGAAVQSLRAQVDKNKYHRRMKRVLEHTKNLRIVQAEAAEIVTDPTPGGAQESRPRVAAVKTTYGGVFECRAVVVATGVYLNSDTITGELVTASGPNGFQNATRLTKSLIKLGYKVRRFKTGTPARLDGRTVDFGRLERQDGEDVYPFSFLHSHAPRAQTPCYLAYTNERTHELILSNLSRAPLYNGQISSTGPRYCPSIETKVVRFRDKERHQLFLEPEGADTTEVYVQGLSTSLPHDLQKEVYRSVKGLEHCEIVRYAYAIEYDCIDTLDVLPTLESKKVEGLYTAGQINGTSGYEEAAAQGLIAGINASLKLRGKPPLILRRDQAYIGVLIDDLVTKGTDEPYRMMTSRAEFRLSLRQDNADVRLTELGRICGLVNTRRYKRFLARKTLREQTLAVLNTRADTKLADKLVQEHGFPPLNAGVTYADLIRRGISIREICNTFPSLAVPSSAISPRAQFCFTKRGTSRRRSSEANALSSVISTEANAHLSVISSGANALSSVISSGAVGVVEKSLPLPLSSVPYDILLSAETEIKYEGYLKASEKEMEKAKKLEEKPLPPDIDYAKIEGLRLEAREKLNRVRPLNLGQAGRISGVSPADVSVLMIWLSLKK